MIAAVACVLGVLATGCVGVIDREDFDRVVEERGGGVSNDLVADAVDLVAERVGVDDLELTNLVIDPGSRLVVLDVRDPEVRENLDRYTVTARDGITDVRPVRVSAGDDLDADTFRTSDVSVLDDLEGLSDTALAELGLEDGHVETVQARVILGAPKVIVNVESPRSGGRVTFDGAGTVEEATRT